MEFKNVNVELPGQHLKPPLGLIPRWVQVEQRYCAVCAAISRYYNAGKKIPIEWIEEYNELIDEL